MLFYAGQVKCGLKVVLVCMSDGLRILLMGCLVGLTCMVPSLKIIMKRLPVNIFLVKPYKGCGFKNSP